MANYLVTDTELESVADAIRAKGGTSADLEFPTDFVSAVSAISTGKNAQISAVVSRSASDQYTALSHSITVAKTGTYTVYWAAFRTSSSGTSGVQLVINDIDYGSPITTWSYNYASAMVGEITGVSLTENDVVTLKARARSTSYYCYVYNLTIMEE